MGQTLSVLSLINLAPMTHDHQKISLNHRCDQRLLFVQSEPKLRINIKLYVWLVVKMLVPGLGANTSFPLGPASEVSCGPTIPSF